MLPYSRQYINKKDIKAVNFVLRSNLITQGSITPKFEKEICKIVKSKHAIATNSATSSLHIACLALGLGKGDILWTVSNSFVASANCGKYCNAEVDFVDIEESTYNICCKDLHKKLIKAKKNKKLPKILVVVHLAGLPAKMKKIKQLSKIFNFKIIEDASHALGAKIYKYPVGSCKFSDITVFSFHPVKMITTGEGGIATTNSLILAKQMSLLREHGIERKKFKNKKKIHKWYYEQQLLGYNYRMSDINAALGLSQLSRLKSIVKQRNKIAKKYRKDLKNLPLRFSELNINYLCSYHLFIIRLIPETTNITRDQLFSLLRKNKIYTNLHYQPIHLQPFYSKSRNQKLPNTISYSKEALSIPIYENLSIKDQNKVINVLKKALKK
jgi:UDP-4-amino-4,6-dideoxy-N-acetyl-beta-L-altrosamine transaminase